ncbi:MAG: hypothetical protein U0103_15815 [Candidatus Obscuribacterales bacterium]
MNTLSVNVATIVRNEIGFKVALGLRLTSRQKYALQSGSAKYFLVS